MSDMGMDKIDEQQQREIDKLRHTIIGLSVMGLFLVLFMALIASNREIVCPHSDCPHSITNIKAAHGE